MYSTMLGTAVVDYLFCSIDKGGRLNTTRALTPGGIYKILEAYWKSAGLPKVAPHDLRRTCAKLCRSQGGEIEQIQFLLGHSSIQTTEKYLGSRQDLQNAVNDRQGIGVEIRKAEGSE